MLDEAKALLLQLGYDIDALEASTNRATGVVDAGTGKMVSRVSAAARQINAEFGKVSADGVRSSFAEIAKLQDHLVDATTAGEKGIAAALRAEIDVRERVQRAAVAQLDTQLAIAKATGNSVQVRELQQVLGLYQQIQKQRAVGVTGSVGLTGAQGVVDALSGAEHGGSGGFNRMQMMELGHSARATFDALAAGASPMRVLAMEGPRVAQALGSGQGGVAGVLKGLLAAVSPTVLALGALGAALAAGVISAVQYVNGVHEIMSALSGLGRTSGATVGQIEDLAEAQSRSGKVSEGAARALAIAMITSGKVTSENLSGATAVVEEFAEVTKTKLADATKIMAKAFEDPAKGARELVETYGLLSGAEVKEIERLQQRGDKTAALTKLIDSMKASLDQASGGLTAHAAGWDAIANAAKNAWTEMGKAVAVSGGLGSLPDRIKDLQQKRASILPGPAGDNIRAEIDRKLAVLQAQQAKEDAQTKANAKDAQLNQKSLSVADAAKALDKKDTEITAIQQRQTELRAALADPSLLARAGLSRAEAQRAINAGDKQIADIRKRGQHTPADQALGFDKSAADAASQGLKDLTTAQAALVTGIHDRAVAEKSAVDADLAKRLKDIDLEAEKIGKAKNDANAKSQLALLRKAKIDEEDAADAKKELIDRQAAEAALAEVIQTRNAVQAERSRIANNDAAMATTRTGRSAIQLANLLAEQKLARDNFDAISEQERTGKSSEINPDAGIWQSDQELYDFNRKQVRDAMVAGQQSDLSRQTYNSAGPLDEYARSVQDLNTTIQGDLVSGIRSFDEALVSIPGHANEAGQILENWFVGLALRIAAHELEADAAPALVSAGKTALAFLGLAGGGQVRGPGTNTSDSIPTMLSDEEYVVNAQATRKNLPLLHAINAGKVLRLAQGGQVGGARPSFPLMRSVASMQPVRSAGVTLLQPLHFHAEGAVVSQDILDQAASHANQAAAVAGQAARAGAFADVQRAGYSNSQNI